MDTTQLERLSALTRALVESTPSPLVRLHYWCVFLNLYLRSGIRSPVYLEDALPEITALLYRAAPDLVDMEFLVELKRLAESPLLPDTPMTAAFRLAVDTAQAPRALVPHTDPDPALHAQIMLVPTGRELLGHKPQLAVPATLSVRASRGLHKPGEVIWRIQRADGDPIDSVAAHALAAALTEAGLTKAALSYEIRLQRAEWALRGGSLGLALAVLFFLFERAERRRSPREISDDVVILGSIDPCGTAIPVSDATLAQKIRAAFGCGYRWIVLPHGNLDQAQSELGRLSARFPGVRAPQLVAVGSLQELLATSELFVRPTRPIRRLVARSRTAGLVLGFGLSIAILGVVFWFRPRVWLPENTSVVLNRHDPSLVTVRHSGFPPRDRHFRFDTQVDTAYVSDFLPVARTALLVGTGVEGPQPATIHCYDLSTARRLWTRDLGDPLALPESTRAVLRFHVSTMITTDLDVDGRPDVIATILANPLSPCFVYWLKEDGTTRSIYAHRGYLFKLRAMDMDLDGYPEVFLAGTANFDGHPLNQNATLVVLDRNHFSGWPEGGPFDGSAHASFDSCLARVVFPPIPEHCQILGSPGYYVKSYGIHSSKRDPFVSVRIGWGSGPAILITLNGDFRPIRIVAEDDLGPIVQKALDSGDIREDFTTHERLNRYLREIQRVR